LQKSCALAIVSALLLPVCVFAQERGPYKPPRLGIGLKISSLGAGVEIATPVSRRSNVRTGFNMFIYDRDFRNDGVAYNGQLSLRSMQAVYDWFPFGGSFHVGGGMLAYNGNRMKANVSSPITTGGTGNLSATGTARIEFRKVAPMFLVGWGNLLPRNGSRVSVPFEFGLVYHGQPRASLHLNNIACRPDDLSCLAVSSDPDVQNGFLAEQSKLRREVSSFKLYPVISVGLGYSF
jgi:hypothetical protein